MSSRLASLCLAAALALPLAPLAAATARADDKAAKPERIPNLEAHLAALDEWKGGDLVKRLEVLRRLADEKRIDASQRRYMSQRVILEHARATGLDKDLVKLVEWLAAQRRDHKGAVSQALGTGSNPIDDMIETYGLERLYRDEAFSKGDIPAKLKRVKELWNARELHQSSTYALVNDLVYRHLAPVAGKIDEELKLFGALYRADVLVWDSTASIHRALLHRALFERPELDSTMKRLAWIAKAAGDKTGDIAWMSVGALRTSLLLQAIDGDAEFTKLDAAGRKAKLEEWKKAGLISSSDFGALAAVYATS